MTGHSGTREVLYRNHGNGNHWISFKLVGTRSNRAAIGAKIRDKKFKKNRPEDRVSVPSPFGPSCPSW